MPKLIRRRYARHSGHDGQLLSVLTRRLRESTRKANNSLDVSLTAMAKMRETIKQLRAGEMPTQTKT